jgi:YggT family protein
MEFVFFFLINVVRIVKYAILIRVLMSWFRGSANGTIARVIFEMTEPILKILRSILPRTGMIDFSPLLAFFALDLLEMGIANLMANI